MPHPHFLRSTAPFCALGLATTGLLMANAPIRAVAATTLQATMCATTMNGVGAAVEVRLNGTYVTTLNVNSSTRSTYTVTLSRALGTGDMVDLRFTNDAYGNGEDRNLYIWSLTSDGTTVTPSASTASYDLGSTWATASDGDSVREGTTDIVSNGSLRVPWPSGEAEASPDAQSGTPVSSAIDLDPSDKLSNTSLPGHQVWAHYIGYGLPDWDHLDGAQYGDDYFLDLVHGDQTTPVRATSGLARAQAAGFTGLQILQQQGGSGTDFVKQWLEAAAPTWSDSDGNNNFSIAPTMSNPTVDDFVREATNYVNLAKDYSAAAKVDGKYVIYVYGSRYNMSAADWATARTRLAAADVPVYVVADLCEDVVNHNWQVPSADIQPYLKSWDATWIFETDTYDLWHQFSTLFNANNTAFAGGITAGYNHEASSDGGYVDPEGTAKFRREWELSLAAGVKWQNIVTYNDLSEQTEVEASSTWNTTRSDINAFYSAKLRGTAYPQSSAQLYITTPKEIRLGEPVKAEGMVLNSTSDAVTVRTHLVDGNGNPVGAAVSTTIAGGSSGDATTPSLPVTTRPAGGFFRAVSTSYDSSGKQLQTATSAPVVVYAADDTPTDDLRRTYYSIPARDALPGAVSLSLNGLPTNAGGAVATVTSPVSNNRFIEVLQNTRLVQRGYGGSSLDAAVPMANGHSTIGGEVINASAHGYYVGRVTDEDERVGYSDPIYVP